MTPAKKAAAKTAAKAPAKRAGRPTGDQAAEPNGKAEAGEEQGEGQQGEQEHVTSHAENITLVISLAILLSVIGLLIYSYVTSGDEPAVIQVRPQMQELWQEGGRYYLPVEIENTGDKTAGSLEVELSLSTPGGEEETSQFSIQYLAGQDSERAVAAFRQDPSQGELTTSISYIEP